MDGAAIANSNDTNGCVCYFNQPCYVIHHAICQRLARYHLNIIQRSILVDSGIVSGGSYS